MILRIRAYAARVHARWVASGIALREAYPYDTTPDGWAVFEPEETR